MFQKYAGAFGLAFALAAGPLAALADSSSAMKTVPQMDDAKIDCATAPAQIAALMQPPSASAMKAPAGTDEAFSAGMSAMMAHEMTIAKIEVQCGKDPKAIAEAKKMAAQLHIDRLTFQNII